MIPHEYQCSNSLPCGIPVAVSSTVVYSLSPSGAANPQVSLSRKWTDVRIPPFGLLATRLRLLYRWYEGWNGTSPHGASPSLRDTGWHFPQPADHVTLTIQTPPYGSLTNGPYLIQACRQGCPQHTLGSQSPQHLPLYEVACPGIALAGLRIAWFSGCRVREFPLSVTSHRIRAHRTQTLGL